MESEISVVYNELCRLCLKKPGVCKIFQRSNLAQDIYLCTGVKITKSKHFPRKICMECENVVHNSNKLRKLAQLNEIHTQELYYKGINLHTKEIKIPSANSECDSSQAHTDDIPPPTVNNIQIVSIYSLPETKDCVENKRKTTHKDIDVKDAEKRVGLTLTENHQDGPVIKKITVRKDLFRPPKDDPNIQSDDTLIKTEGSGETGYDKDTTYCDERTNNYENNQCYKDSDGDMKFDISKAATIIKSSEPITYVCAVCPKTFKSWKKVYCHQRLHNKNIPCPIDACGKKFASKNDLAKHIRIHTGERPYVCDVCNRAFSQQGTLRSHKETVHPIKASSD